MSKTVLVTGASSGIGEATVRALLADGCKVFAAARRLDRMAPLGAAGATLLPLDVTDDASIVAAVAAIKTVTGRLDVLINNAGYGSFGALEDVPLAEARRQCEVNPVRPRAPVPACPADHARAEIGPKSSMSLR